MLHNDIPTLAQIEALANTQDGWRVSLYLVSGVTAQEAEIARIALKDETKAAVAQLEAEGASVREVAAIRDHLDDIIDDSAFWAAQSRSLAVFVDADRAVTFRLPNHLAPHVAVAHRYLVKPLLRAISFPQAAYVLTLSQTDIRLLAITPDEQPRRVDASDLPEDFETAVRHHFHAGQTVAGRMQGEEGEKTRLRQFARIVDRGVRTALGGSQLPVILAATEPLDGIFRSVSTLPQLAEQGIPGNPESHTDAQLGEAARTILDSIYAAELKQIAATVSANSSAGKSATDLSELAHAAAYGAIDTLVFDMDATRPGSVDAATGEVTFSDGDAPIGIVDDIVRLALSSGARVIAAHKNEVPAGGEAAAILRYAV
jgi:hypothetical protein